MVEEGLYSNPAVHTETNIFCALSETHIMKTFPDRTYIKLKIPALNGRGQAAHEIHQPGSSEYSEQIIEQFNNTGISCR